MTDSSSPRRPAGPRGGASAPALLLSVTLVAAACAGGRLASVRTVPVTSLSEAMECARERGDEMDFRTDRYDEEEHRLVLERDDPDVGLSDPTFRKAVDQLTLSAGEGPGRPLEVTARTYYEFVTRRGRTRRQREASAGARAAADSLVRLCADGGAAGM